MPTAIVNNQQQRRMLISVALLFSLLAVYGFWQAFLPVAAASSTEQQQSKKLIERMSREPVSAMALEKLSWYETAVFNQVLLGAVLLLFLSVFLVGLANIVRHYLRPGRVVFYARLAGAAHWTMVAVAGWFELALSCTNGRGHCPADHLFGR